MKIVVDTSRVKKFKRELIGRFKEAEKKWKSAYS